MESPLPPPDETVGESLEIPPPLDRRSLNLPNLITAVRLVLALVLFVLIDRGRWWLGCAVLFIVAASTDFLDGYLARKWKQVTVLGRILDPFVDKVIVCGAFIFLTAYPDSGVCPWLTFLVIAREMFVTSLRSILEQTGTDFSAKWSGKLKMVIQSATVPVCLASLSESLQAALGTWWPQWILLRDVLIWGAAAITLYSGVEYTVRGFWLIGKQLASGAADQ